MCEAEGIRYTLAQYSQFMDDRRHDEIADLFTESGSWTVMGVTFEGRDSIRKYMSTFEPPRSQVKHMTLDSIIDIRGGSAVSVSNFIVLSETPAGGVVVRAGRYHDDLVKEGDRWHFAQRTHASTTWSPGWRPPHP